MPTDIRMLFGRLPPFTHYAGNRWEWGHWSCTDKQKVGRRRAMAFAKVLLQLVEFLCTGKRAAAIKKH